MSSTADLMAYILKSYPFKEEMSNARLTKMVYLCDWKHSLERGRQITDIVWYYNNYGPFVDDVCVIAENTPLMFRIDDTINAYGDPKRLIKLANQDVKFCLSDEEIVSADLIIEATKQLNWNDFIRLVYSTYPIMSSEKYSYLNLVEKATEYKQYLRTRSHSSGT